jgi:hypothetical protein
MTEILERVKQQRTDDLAVEKQKDDEKRGLYIMQLNYAVLQG